MAILSRHTVAQQVKKKAIDFLGLSTQLGFVVLVIMQILSMNI